MYAAMFVRSQAGNVVCVFKNLPLSSAAPVLMPFASYTLSFSRSPPGIRPPADFRLGIGRSLQNTLEFEAAANVPGRNPPPHKLPFKNRCGAHATGGVEIGTAQTPHLRIDCIRAQIKNILHQC